ncbi:MAG TPA: MFS transporter [Streptosporangiaceae bacterium]|nr:MFS transporter [Streptosporangiaceae bacterium]
MSAAPVRPARDGPIWRDRDFGIFLVAQTLSVGGDSFAYIAIPLLVLRATGSVAKMGLLTGVAGAASVVAGIFAGIIVDRVNRRLLLVCCDLARMLLYAAIPLAWLAGPQVWLLFVVLPVCEAIGMLFQVTYVTAVPSLVRSDAITEANGLLYAAASAAGIAGPLLAGVVSGALGPTAAIAIDAASFGLSAAGAALIRFRVPAVSTVQADGRASQPDGRPWRELLAGVAFLWRQPVLRALTVLLTLFIFLTFGLTDVVIYYLKHDLGQPDGIVGLVLAAGGAGTVAGALLVAPLRRRLGFGPVWIGGLTVCGIAVAFIGLAGSAAAVAVLAAVYLGCAGVAGICSMSLRQQVTPAHLLGRVTSAFWTVHFSLGPVGAAVLTWAAGHYGVAATCATSGAACVMLAVAALYTPVRGRAHGPATAAAT